MTRVLSTGTYGMSLPCFANQLSIAYAYGVHFIFFLNLSILERYTWITTNLVNRWVIISVECLAFFTMFASIWQYLCILFVHACDKK